MKHELNIPRKEQETTNWCWAACAQMVINFLKDIHITQTQIVAVMYDVPVSQVSPQNPECNSPANVHQIETVFQDYAVRYEFLKKTLTYEELTKELDKGPVEIGIQWKSGGMHAIIAYGYNTNGRSIKEVLIRDPWKDMAPIVTVDYSNLINGNYAGKREGKWIDTFWKFEKI